MQFRVFGTREIRYGQQFFSEVLTSSQAVCKLHTRWMRTGADEC